MTSYIKRGPNVPSNKQLEFIPHHRHEGFNGPELHGTLITIHRLPDGTVNYVDTQQLMMIEHRMVSRGWHPKPDPLEALKAAMLSDIEEINHLRSEGNNAVLLENVLYTISNYATLIEQGERDVL